jgi:hypothetical protein
LNRSKRFAAEANLVGLPAYWRVNVRVGVGWPQLSVIAHVDNICDNRII